MDDLKEMLRVRRISVAVVLGLLIVNGFSAVAAKPMNVIFILADDLGWSDTELYGTANLLNAIPEEVANGTWKGLFSVTTFWKADDPLRPSGLFGLVSILNRADAK